MKSGYSKFGTSYTVSSANKTIDQYLKEIENNVEASQQELFPQHVTLSPNDASLLKEINPDLEKIGFRIQQMSANTFVINGTPADSKNKDAVALLEKILDMHCFIICF